MIPTTDNAYAFNFTSIDNQPLPLEQFAGKVLLVVNTASKCGFTKQYTELEALYKKYQDQGLVILGIPSNDFGGQEPADEAAIKEFCSLNYGVSFPLTSKQKVKGKSAHPFYIWAKEKLGMLSAPKWNFHKYLINRQGELVDFYMSTTTPQSSKIQDAIEKCLSS